MLFCYGLVSDQSQLTCFFFFSLVEISYVIPTPSREVVLSPLQLTNQLVMHYKPARKFIPIITYSYSSSFFYRLSVVSNKLQTHTSNYFILGISCTSSPGKLSIQMILLNADQVQCNQDQIKCEEYLMVILVHTRACSKTQPIYPRIKENVDTNHFDKRTKSGVKSFMMTIFGNVIAIFQKIIV